MERPARNLAVLYLRSSKDRSDVSIEAQRHELQRFAVEKNLTIVAEYVDVVESGKDDDRAGFQQLYEDLRGRARTWQIVIALDTSRIARRRLIAVVFEDQECAPRGVKVLYKSLSGIDPESEVLLKATLQGIDEWHSLVSRRKARSGMATNVRRGFRAGGRAPLGYRLNHIDTGAMREGRPVLKSKLEIEEAIAPAVQKYLRARAVGTRRRLALEESGLDREKTSQSSLVGLEWNALTYAGATVWNVHQMRHKGAYVTHTKRRPREEWEIKRGTHPALITEEEAEHILAQLEAYSVNRPRRSSANYVLTGLLKTREDKLWVGQQAGRYYRVGSRHVNARRVDETVLEKVAEDLRSREFARRILERVQATAGKEHLTEARKLKQAANTIASRISRFMDMAANLDAPGPVLRKVDELERDRMRIENEAAALQREAQISKKAKALTEKQVSEHLDILAEGLDRLDRDRLKTFLGTILTSITLDPDSDQVQLHYRIALRSSFKVASPRERDLNTYGRLTTCAHLKKAA